MFTQNMNTKNDSFLKNTLIKNLNELFIRVFSEKDIRFFALKRRKCQWDKCGNLELMMELKVKPKMLLVNLKN